DAGAHSRLHDRGSPKALPHARLIASALMIGHHFAASAFTRPPSASAVCRSRGKISSPRAIKRDRTAGSASASTAAALSLPMMSFGVFLSAKNPYQADQESAGSLISAKVGVSGACATRGSLVTA